MNHSMYTIYLQIITPIHAIFTLPHVRAFLNVHSKATETMSKTGTSPFISVHLKSSYFSASGEKRLLKLTGEPLPAGRSPGNQKEVF